MDDLLVFSASVEEHFEHLKKVFEALNGAGLKIKKNKCKLFRREGKYLGHTIGEEDIRTDPEKFQAIADFQEPTNLTEVRRFYGLSSYYPRFIKNFSQRAKPLSDLTRKNVVFQFGDRQRDAFKEIREALVKAPVLQHPDFTRPFYVQTDASNNGLVAILAQRNGQGAEYIVACVSRNLRPAELNYTPTEKEVLAVCWVLKKFKPFSYGYEIVVQTDHSAFKQIMDTVDPVGHIARWILLVKEFRPRIEHRKGTEMSFVIFLLYKI
ncbi:uncharacterized protein VTP21DRAFT_9054 [Calcarisporiella thermophila]|uniref:uncharacterized protein n=1 Tax=Calcarisporiella thermophila TaxID=911321 RepID=UPI003741F319